MVSAQPLKREEGRSRANEPLIVAPEPARFWNNDQRLDKLLDRGVGPARCGFYDEGHFNKRIAKKVTRKKREHVRGRRALEGLRRLERVSREPGDVRPLRII